MSPPLRTRQSVKLLTRKGVMQACDAGCREGAHNAHQRMEVLQVLQILGVHKINVIQFSSTQRELFSLFSGTEH